MNSLGILRLLLCLPFLCSTAIAAGSDVESIVHSYIEAYNQHDLEGMLDPMHGNVRWMMVSADEIEVVTAALAEILSS